MLSKKIGMLFTFLDSALLPQLLNGLYGEGGDNMKITIEVPDSTLALVATFVYNGDKYPCINMETKVLTTEDIEKQREVTE